MLHVAGAYSFSECFSFFQFFFPLLNFVFLGRKLFLDLSQKTNGTFHLLFSGIATSFGIKNVKSIFCVISVFFAVLKRFL